MRIHPNITAFSWGFALQISLKIPSISRPRSKENSGNPNCRQTPIFAIFRAKQFCLQDCQRKIKHTKYIFQKLDFERFSRQSKKRFLGCFFCFSANKYIFGNDLWMRWRTVGVTFWRDHMLRTSPMKFGLKRRKFTMRHFSFVCYQRIMEN